MNKSNCYPISILFIIFTTLTVECYALNIKDQPISFIGHGAMFDSSGKNIEVTTQFIENSQKYYIKKLRDSLPENIKKEFDNKKELLFKEKSWNKQTTLYANSFLLDWLLGRVDLQDAGGLKGKNQLFKYYIKTRIFSGTFNIPNELKPLAGGSSGVVLFSTTASGAAYITECENAGVPIPPDWDKDDPRWVKSSNSTLTPNFLGGNANVFYYESDSSPGPKGVCIALPRDSGGDIYALGIICQGEKSSNVCYWDNQKDDEPFDIGQNEDVPISDFAGGAELFGGKGGTCTACHAGENTFVIHPGSALDIPVNTQPDNWYNPLVHPDWPQNAGPYTGLSEGTQCTDSGCHQQGAAGRFPKISSAINIGNDSYCNAVLNPAIGNTMPPGGNTADFEEHIGILQGLCNATPTPVMRIEETVLDYNQVELGFSFTKGLVIHNDGDAALTFSITAPTVAEDSDVTQWDSVPTATDNTINPGDPPEVFRYIYSPDEIAGHTFQIDVSSNDVNQTVTLTGEGSSPTPIDTMLVLDRSGSMQDAVGERRKIDAMRDSASLYADLLRDEVGDTGTGDKLGFVKYNDTNSIYEVFTEMDTAKRTTINDNKLSSAALSDSGRLNPEDATGIGGAMQTAAFQFGGALDNRRQVMVVLTDGIENREPYISDVISPIRTTFPDLKMYSIGLGENIEPTKLQSITNITDGYHQVAAVLSDTTLFDLETFYGC